MFNKGFIITDDNKEDVFIEIIEKDDDKLLNILERYLQEREDFEVFRKLLIKFYKIIKLKLLETKKWWTGRDLNPRPPHSQCGALPV